jgi:hypothetical protein
MRCPNGSRKNKKTGNCEPKPTHTHIHTPKRCPNGSRKNKKTGNCVGKRASESSNITYRTALNPKSSTKYHTASLFFDIDFETTSKEFDDIKQMTRPIDIFDIKVFHLENELLSRYYSNLELLLRTSILVDYIHNHRKITKKGYYKLMTEFKSYEKKDFDNILNVFDMQYLLEKWFYHFKKTNKDADKTDIQVENLLLKYRSHENMLWNRLYKKYVDKNWNTNYKLWFDDDDD